MPERTVKLENLSLQMTYDTVTGVIADAVIMCGNTPMLNSRAINGKIVLVIDPRGTGWAWNKQKTE